MILETVMQDGGLYVCHVTSQVLDKSVLSRPLELEVLGELSSHGIDVMTFFAFFIHRSFYVFNIFTTFLVHGQVTIIFVVFVCLSVCLCRVFLSRL